MIGVSQCQTFYLRSVGAKGAQRVKVENFSLIHYSSALDLQSATKFRPISRSLTDVPLVKTGN